MSFASTNRVALRRVAESQLGTTPSTPTFKPIRYTSESLNYNLSNIVSEEIRDDRQTTDLIQVQSDASGDVNFELSYEAYEDFLEAVMASTFSADLAISSSGISAEETGNHLLSSGLFTNVQVGQWIKVDGFTASANNGYHLVTVKTSASDIQVASTLTDESAGNTITINGSILRNGTTVKSFSLQKYLADATTPTWINYFGALVNSLSLNVQTGQIVTGVFNMMALGATVATSAIAGQTVSAASAKDVMNAVGNVVGITFDGVPSTLYFQSLTAQITNNIRAQDAVGSLPHVGLVHGRFEVTGGLALYFENPTMYQKYLAATAFSISFRFQDADGNAYVATMPKVKFETAPLNAGGRDQDMLLNATYRALYDPVTGCTMQFDRFAAA